MVYSSSSSHSSSNIMAWSSICSSQVRNMRVKWLGLLKCPTTSCNTKIPSLQQRSVTPPARTPVMLIVYTFYSDSQLMKPVTSSNATFLPIRILPTTLLAASGTLNEVCQDLLQQLNGRICQRLLSKQSSAAVLDVPVSWPVPIQFFEYRFLLLLVALSSINSLHLSTFFMPVYYVHETLPKLTKIENALRRVLDGWAF